MAFIIDMIDNNTLEIFILNELVPTNVGKFLKHIHTFKNPQLTTKHKAVYEYQHTISFHGSTHTRVYLFRKCDTVISI